MLKHLVCANGLVLDVNDIASYMYKHHKYIYSQLSDNPRYKELIPILYQHNKSLRDLRK